MIGRQLERLRRARRLDGIVVATSIDASDDDAGGVLSRASGVPVVRGSLDDVLERFVAVLDEYRTGRGRAADGRLPARQSGRHRHGGRRRSTSPGRDYVSNTLQPTYPGRSRRRGGRGGGAAVGGRHTDRPARARARHPGRVPATRAVRRRATSLAERDLSALRWTVDNADDLAFVRAVYDALYPRQPGVRARGHPRDLCAPSPRCPHYAGRSAQRRSRRPRHRSDECLTRSPSATPRPSSYLARAEAVIPLGSQTFSKSRTQYPVGAAPLFAARSQGSHTWDIDGNEYVDLVCSLGAVTLGYWRRGDQRGGDPAAARRRDPLPRAPHRGRGRRAARRAHPLRGDGCASARTAPMRPRQRSASHVRSRAASTSSSAATTAGRTGTSAARACTGASPSAPAR